MLQTLSTTPPKLDHRLVGFAESGSFESEQYRRLRYRVEELADRVQARVIAITSPASHDGKTLTAVNLAASLAQGKQARVLLIDADLRRPTVASTLGLDVDKPGLLTLLGSNGLDLDRYLQRVGNLDVLPCERRQANTYDVLTAAAFVSLIAAVRSRYSMVIVDTPPVVPVPDTSLLGRIVDGYLLVVAANATPRKLVGEALSLLEQQAVLGLVFNRDVRPLFGYYGAHYRSYFETRTS